MARHAGGEKRGPGPADAVHPGDAGTRPGRIPLRSAGLAALCLAAAGALGLAALSFANAGPSTAATSSGTWRGGVVVLTSSSASASASSTARVVPGAAERRCVVVRYEGDVPADVRLTVLTPGPAGALSPYLQLTVVEGQGGSGTSCDGFTPEPGRQPLAGSLADLAGTRATWQTAWRSDRSTAPGEVRTYLVEQTVADDNAAQGLTAQYSLRWEARPA